MGYYSALKRNKTSRHGKTWRNFKCILINEKGHSEKAPYDVIPTTVMTFWKRQNYGEYKKVSDRQWAEKMEVWKGGMNR